ncbi:unnamed protein product [Clonostachys rosea]|uniref:Major facilitator superfamily (MFS) profile domain-containing protein n=1 Tax=Bionectria ochroleuca TaxID=29856 RepID=A0ABY6V407_BIOOC|nr:unnamed protein product [Clonostachys rosea]
MAAIVNPLDTLSKDTRPWYKVGHLRKLNYIVLSLVMFSSSNGYDGSIMGSLLALTRWNEFMGNPSGAYLGWIAAIYWLGTGIAFPCAAWVSNRYGRKPGIYLGYLFLILGVGMQGAAQNEVTFTYARLFFGIASAWLGNGPPLLINEIAYPTHRPVASSFFMCGFYVGGTLCAWVTFGCRNIASTWCWRIPAIMQIVLPFLALPGFLMCPESPRWLVSVGRNEEAAEILAKYHAGGDRNSDLVVYQMREIEATINAEKEAASSASYADMIKTPGNRHRLFISVTLGIFGQWAGNGIITYYLPSILNSIGVRTVTEQTLISACLNVWNLLWAVAAACSVDKLGRRVLFLCSASIMLVSMVIVTGLSATFARNESPSVGLAVIPFLFTFYLGYDIALTPFMTAYPCEIWQFTLRSHGVTVTWVSTIAAIFFNTFVNPIALESIQWRYYIVFIVVLVVMFVTVYFFYPETRGYSLEQMAVIFDGDDMAAVAIASEKMGAIVEQHEEHADRNGGEKA